MSETTGGSTTRLLPCDLVMKGGITSGVVYPKLIGRLARDYQFKSIGGTSAGAIAAAGCAAAELGRQTGKNLKSFEDLGKLPGELGTPKGEPMAPMLFHLFQPAPDLRSHFAVLEGALNAPDTWAAVKRAMWALLKQYWALALLAGAGSLATLVPSVMGTTGLSRWLALGGAVGLLAVWLAALLLALALPGVPKLTPLLAALLAVSAATVVIARWLSAPWSMAVLLALACAVAVPLAIALALGLVVLALRSDLAPWPRRQQVRPVQRIDRGRGAEGAGPDRVALGVLRHSRGPQPGRPAADFRRPLGRSPRRAEPRRRGC